MRHERPAIPCRGVHSLFVFDIVGLHVERLGMTDDHDAFEDGEQAGVPEGLPCVELEFETLRRFREEMAPYLNYDGFFARTESPLPRGTTVAFKFGMPEEFVLAEGTAVVAWTIEPEGNPELVPGMALRFGHVGKQSRAVIDELVDFHIATGGDPFDLGPQTARAGEIPTDSLGGAGGGGSSTIDSPAPVARELPLPPDPIHEAPADDGVLPDWLSEPAAPVVEKTPETDGGFDFQATPDTGPAPASSSSGGFDFPTDDSGDEFEVDMVFDNGNKELPPKLPEEGSFQQMALNPRAENKPPRDLRIGLIVTAAIVLVAVMVLVWSVWLKRPGQEAEVNDPMIEEPTQVGVVLIDDDVEGTESEGGGESAPEGAGDTATGPKADSAGESAPAEPVVEQPGPQVDEPAEAVVSERQTESASQPVQQTRASRVVDVTTAARAHATTVVIRGNGAFEASGLRTLLLEDPKRLWASISPIETFYRPNEINVGSPEVERVRIGFHPEDSPPALYVVLDLVGEDVVLLDANVQGDAIRLTVGRK